MELHLSERRTGVWRMTLAANGAVTACLGSASHSVSNGQYHYKPAGEREHHETTERRLMALAGRWAVTDGVATLRFDQVSWHGCGLGGATKLDKPLTELRCIGVAPAAGTTDRRLACEATDQSQLLGLGMPMTIASRKRTGAPWHSAPAGRNLMFGAPGLAVVVTQDSRSATSTITFRPSPVTLVETDYRE
jgi:hypothetical protein